LSTRLRALSVSFAADCSIFATGFCKVRLESFDGAHIVYGLHLGEALRWFAAQASSSSAATRESEFDKIFKKKP
jgi:hypothetical protein